MVCNHSQGSQKTKTATMLEQPKKVFSCSPVQSCDCKPPPVKDKVSMPLGPDPGCLGNACRQCVSPCQRTFTSIPTCKKNCGNSKICHESCDFLGYLKSLPNVLDGNKSLTIKPGDPMATAKNLTSLTLSWKPTKSIGGSVVYVLKERFKGDFAERVKDMANLVFTEPRAVLDVRDICRYTPHSRRSWDGLQFLFKVVALTEYSQLVESTESAEIEPVRPEPVSSIGMPNMSYDASAFGDKLKLTTVVIPYKAQVSFISRYAMVWSSVYCDGSPAVIPRSAFSRGASTTIEMHIYEKLKLCKHSLQVYSLNQCIPSLPKTLTYEYKGCRFVSNFDRAFCYSFDPPPTPDSARSVGSLAHSPLQITRDFRVNTNITWLPPTFPYGKVQYYIYAYGDIKKKLFGLIWMATRGITKETSLNLENLLPNITVRVEINPSFPNAVGVRQTILFRTPGVPEDKIAVRYISADDFQFSSANLFSVRLEWKKPLCDSNLYHGYRIKFVKGNDPAKTVNTSDTFCVIHSLGHQEPLVVMVKPVYGQDWIKPKDVVLNLQAPAPNVQDIVVRNLAIHNFTYHQHDNTFTAYFKWDTPSYRYRTIDYYQVGYTLIGGYTCPSNDVKIAKQCMPAKTVDSHYSIPGVPRQGHVVIWVKPVFKSSPFFEGIKNTLTVSPPNYDVWFCKEKPEGYYADVQDCKVFYRCDAHGKAYHLLCPARLYWNDNTTTCDLPHNVKCQKDYHSFCQGKSAGHYEDVQNYAAYYECDGKGRGFHFLCSDGLEWKQEIKACDLSTRQ